MSHQAMCCLLHIAHQLIRHGRLDFLMFDYLSEITMSLLTAARAKKPEFGFAPDFVLYALGPHLAEMKRQGVYMYECVYLCICLISLPVFGMSCCHS